MRSAIVSDIHGNVEAFDIALAQVGDGDVLLVPGRRRRVWAESKRVRRASARTRRLTIIGNHDLAAIENFGVEWFNPAARQAIRWTQGVLSPENASGSTTLDYEHRACRLLLVHGAPHPDYFAYIAR